MGQLEGSQLPLVFFRAADYSHDFVSHFTRGYPVILVFLPPDPSHLNPTKTAILVLVPQTFDPQGILVQLDEENLRLANKVGEMMVVQLRTTGFFATKLPFYTIFIHFGGNPGLPVPYIFGTRGSSYLIYGQLGHKMRGIFWDMFRPFPCHQTNLSPPGWHGTCSQPGDTISEPRVYHGSM